MKPQQKNIAKLVLIAGLAIMLSQSAAAFAFVGVSVGFGVNVGYAPAPVVREVVAPCPGPGYLWVGGHWGWRPAFARYAWVPGAWAVPPFRHAAWVGPRFVVRGGGRYFVGGHWRR